MAGWSPVALLLLALSAVGAAPTERMLMPNSFNCFTRERWTEEKRTWCCENKSLGCSEGRQEPIMVLGGGGKGR
eukprot:scaffold96993_cov35-Tisochrysis_lutea.AAC.1